MKVIAKYQSKLIDEENNILAQFKIEEWNSKKRVEELDKTKIYQLEIKEVKSKRSIKQNKLLWKIISDLVDEIKTTDYEVDEMNIYINLLKATNCEYEYLILSSKKIADKLKESFRAVEFIRTQRVNDKECYVYKCYLGSSKFTVSEMNLLIEIAINWASEFNLKYDKDQYYE